NPPLEETQLEAVYFEGLEFLHTDEFEKALERFERVAETRPDYRDVKTKLTEARRNHQRAGLVAKIEAAQDQADWGQAIEALQALIALCPDEPDLADRLAQARRQMELKKLWEETAELYKRGKWRAVVKSFEKMRAIDPELTDRENWLAEAQQALEREEIERMVKVHQREALEHFESKEWGKALNALNSVLKLDPGNETAVRLSNKARAEVAQSEAAARLAERYDNGKQAMAGERWEDAVVLLKLVSQENPGYQDVAALLEQANERFLDTQAELDVALSVYPKEAEPDCQVTWTLTINNYSQAPISDIT